MRDYDKKEYVMSAQETNDKLTVSKGSGSDWVMVMMTTNNEQNGHVTIRSKAMAEQLHFMLGQMLGL